MNLSKARCDGNTPIDIRSEEVGDKFFRSSAAELLKKRLEEAKNVFDRRFGLLMAVTLFFPLILV